MSDAPEPRTPPVGGPPSPPAYAPPAGHAPPAAFPPVPYHPHPGYAAAAGHTPHAGPFAPPPPPHTPLVGRIALILGIVAAAGASLVAALAAFNVGLGAGRELALRPFDAGFDWSVLTPVREWVLLAELSFWVASVVGVWALIQGIVAIATRRGRGPGIAAVVIAALGPVAFALTVQAFLMAGLSAGTGIAA